MISSGHSQTSLSANIQGDILITNLSSYQSGGEEGCSGFLLSLGADSTAEITSIASYQDVAGHSGAFCITAEQTTVVSFSQLSVSSNDGFSDDGAGITTVGGIISIDLAVFSNLSANFGSAINARDFASLFISNSEFNQLGDSQRSNGGGAIFASSYVPGAEFRLVNCTSNLSSVGGFAGGFLLLEGTTSATIDSNQLTASYCNYGYGGFIMLRDLADTAVTNTIFSSGFASKGSGIACVNSTGTTLDVVQFQDMSSTSLDAEHIDLFGYNCASPVWTSQEPCSTISCTSCASTVCGSDPPLAVCSCYCTGIGDDCDVYSAPTTTAEPLPSASRTPSVPAPSSPSPSTSPRPPPNSSYSSGGADSSGSELPDQIPFAVVFTVAAFMVILVVVLVGFLAVFGFFAYVKYFKPQPGSSPSYDPIAMADPVTPQRDGDKYQYDVDE